MTNQEIKDYIAKMVPEGYSLSQIQDTLKKEGVNVTFMELRLIASELESEVWQKEDAKKEEERKKEDQAAILAQQKASQGLPEKDPYGDDSRNAMAPGMGRGMGRLPEEEEEDLVEENAMPGAPMPPPMGNENSQEAETPEEARQEGGTVVELSPIARPGAVASGTVKFASGVTADWVLDRTGRVGLDNPTGSPTQQDIQEFQMELQKLFAR